jgi:hypothetical protein
MRKQIDLSSLSEDKATYAWWRRAVIILYCCIGLVVVAAVVAVQSTRFTDQIAGN